MSNDSLGLQAEELFGRLANGRNMALAVNGDDPGSNIRQDDLHVTSSLLECIVQAYSSLAKNLPQDIKEFVNRLNRNQFKIDLEHRGLEKLVTDLDRSSNRVSFAVVIGSLIVGSSLVMQIDKGPMILGFPLLGLLGYSIAGFLGLWLAIGILRSGRL